MINRLPLSILKTTLFSVALSTALVVTSSQSIAATKEIQYNQRDYVVQPGDSLKSIAQTELGKIGLAPHLAEFNGLTMTTKLEVGETLQIPLYAEFEREFARIIYMKGSATVDDSNAQRDDEIYINQLIATGDDGFISMMFKSGSVINMQPNTTAKLVALNCLANDPKCLIEVQSDKGELTSDVKKTDAQPADFRITTPYASAAVRGTMFDVSVSESGLGIGVTEGGVGIAAQGEAVELDMGFGSITETTGVIGEPIPLLPAPVYRYVPTRAAKGDRALWWGLSGVETYIAQLTRDEEARELSSSSTGEAAEYVFGDDEAGEYYLNIRGVDENGLKGFNTSTKITVASIDESIDTVDTEITFDGNEYLVSVTDKTRDVPGYEIQVSTDKSFDNPLSADINQRSEAVFRVPEGKLYSRARVLVAPTVVSAFGSVSETP